MKQGFPPTALIVNFSSSWVSWSFSPGLRLEVTMARHRRDLGARNQVRSFGCARWFGAEANVSAPASFGAKELWKDFEATAEPRLQQALSSYPGSPRYLTKKGRRFAPALGRRF